jgi:hypothetical protein
LDTHAAAVPVWAAAITTLSLDTEWVDYDDDLTAPADLTHLTSLLHRRVSADDERGFPTRLPPNIQTVTTTGKGIGPSQIAGLAARLPSLQAIHSTSGVTEQQAAAALAAGIRLHAHVPRGGEYGAFAEFGLRRKRRAGDVVPGLRSQDTPHLLKVEVPRGFAEDSGRGGGGG